MKKLAILQSNYIPWKGYFDLIAAVDEFIIYDEMQYTKRDWRNRNLIKTDNGLQWLTVPVKAKGKFEQKISETLIDGPDWKQNHWKAIVHNYKKAKYFNEIASILEPVYIHNGHDFLSDLNCQLIQIICNYLNIKTSILQSKNFQLGDGKTEKLLNICLQSNANLYISGPSAKNYIKEDLFHENNIEIQWFDYSGYPIYSQLWDGFEHGVTILDLLFNHGKDSYLFMKSIQK
jgi:hypothetical protein